MNLDAGDGWAFHEVLMHLPEGSELKVQLVAARLRPALSVACNAHLESA
jgi:hypothetical protein